MKRALAAIVLSMVLWSCAPLLDPQSAALPGAAVPDARTAMTAAQKACHVSTLDVWLSPYRWHAKLIQGYWHVRVPAFQGSLDCAYYDVDIRAADGDASNCDSCYPDTVIIASAK
jgi:hypothetical protein